MAWAAGFLCMAAAAAGAAALPTARTALATNLAAVQWAPHAYRLRLCNAYAWPDPLEMRRLQEPKLVEYPLPYKACHDYTLPLSEGDQLQFRVGDLNIGTFAVRGLPSAAAMLLLIPHRRDSTTSTVVFASHIFSPSSEPQVAVIDAYCGPEKSRITVTELWRPQSELKFNSVVTMSAGSYGITLASTGTELQVTTPQQLRARPQEFYAVFRVGNGEGDNRWPEELVLFPTEVRSAAVRAGSAWAVAIALPLLAHLLRSAWH